MIEISLNKNKYHIPGSWQEVTVQQYIQIMEHSGELNPLRMLAIFTGIDYDTLNNFEYEGTEKLFVFFDFLREPFDLDKLKRAETITIGGINVPVIQNPGRERVGQKLRMTGIIGQVENSPQKIPLIIPPIIANYYAPYLHGGGQWIESQLPEVEEQVKKMPIVQAAPEAYFFLTGYIKGSKKRQRHTRLNPGKLN